MVGLLVVLAVAVPLLVVAVVVDVRSERRRRTDLATPPERDFGAVDRLVPAYVSQDDVDALPARAGAQSPPTIEGNPLEGGHAHPDFATHREWAHLERPAVLVVEDALTSMRELLVPLQSVPDHPLVVAALAVDPTLLQTLRANRRATGLNLVVAILDEVGLLSLADLAGCEVLRSSDLKAGYVPAAAMGSLRVWASTLDQIRVVPSSSSGT